MEMLTDNKGDNNNKNDNFMTYTQAYSALVTWRYAHTSITI